jgi:hypothetical protein
MQIFYEGFSLRTILRREIKNSKCINMTLLASFVEERKHMTPKTC